MSLCKRQMPLRLLRLDSSKPLQLARLLRVLLSFLVSPLVLPRVMSTPSSKECRSQSQSLQSSRLPLQPVVLVPYRPRSSTS
ncbi:MAG: hypothetical protein J3R72DRAFT_443503 [Linnemannia gamsii]|nr:MAG: hypothetical protein J3R72DRAFT_443503 [Linnemannia gamsii]